MQRNTKKQNLRILIVSNNREHTYEQLPRGWIALPYLFSKLGCEIMSVRKKDLLKFYQLYKKFKPDIIVSSWVPAGNIPVFLRKLGLIKCPIVHAWDDYYEEMMTNYPRFIVRFLENNAIKNSDYITTVSRYNESRAIKMGKKVFFIPHGTNKKSKKTKISLNALKMKKNNLKIIYLGDQSRYKKVDKLINAVKNLSCDLFLFGKENTELKENASENVHFMSQIPPEEVQSVLQQADLLVNTSDQDCNFKFFEYIKAGKPILAYEGKASYAFKHKENAYLTKDFRKGIIELTNNKELREKLKRNIKKIKTYTWEEIARQYLDLLERLASKKPNVHRKV